MNQKTIFTKLNMETYRQFEKAAAMAGMTKANALKSIISNGPEFFLTLLVESTKRSAKSASAV